MTRYRNVSARLCVYLFLGICLWSWAGAEPPPSADEQIRRALEGGASESAPRDGILADVLDLIGERGSVLEGSVLDDNLVDPSTGKTTFKSSDSVKARTAEQLLKASRMLEDLPSQDRTRIELVNKMRQEAVKLLTE